uniref:Uncharacterized protein n=1 Tax=Helianthus annuus TaxID=4232 RepID=A0A251S2R8_HELAN
MAMHVLDTCELPITAETSLNQINSSILEHLSFLIVKATSKCYLGINRTFIRRPGKSYHHLSFVTYTCSGTIRK